MSQQDCYFFVDVAVPEEDQTMSAICVPCHGLREDGLGWFYKGSEGGYGPFDIVCCGCGCFIHKMETDDEEDDPAAGQDPRG